MEDVKKRQETGQYVVPEEVPGVTSYEFSDWATSEASQRALLEIDRAVAAAEILYKQMSRKRREVGRSMEDLNRGIAYAADKYKALAKEMDQG